jgi:hypothetical protein
MGYVIVCIRTELLNSWKGTFMNNMGIFITSVPIFLAVYFSTQGILYLMPGKYKYFLSSTEPVIQKLFTLLLIVLVNCCINEFF